MTTTQADDAAGTPLQRYARREDFRIINRAFIEVSEKVKEQDLLRRSPIFYLATGTGLALALVAVAAGMAALGDSWLQLLLAAALGVIFTQIAFLAHEAGHRQILTSGPANDRLARVLAAIVGLSYSWWDAKHSRHHANPNKVRSDPDIEVDTISFLAEDAAQARGVRRAITRRQGWLFFPLLTLEGVNLAWHSFRHLLGPGPVKARWYELALLTVRSALVYAPIFMLLPLGKALAFVAVMLAVFGVYMGASFAPNHKGMPVIAPDAKLDFFSKQVRTSRNIRGGWWMTAFMGGLNYQIEHHLFPNMARPHLKKAQRIVRDFCEAHDVPYTETTLWESYRIVIAYLNRVGLAARDPFVCPMVAQYRRG